MKKQDHMKSSGVVLDVEVDYDGGTNTTKTTEEEAEAEEMAGKEDISLVYSGEQGKTLKPCSSPIVLMSPPSVLFRF